MLCEYWSEFPPVHEMVRSYKPASTAKKGETKFDDPAFNAPFLSLFQGGVLRG